MTNYDKSKVSPRPKLTIKWKHNSDFLSKSHYAYVREDSGRMRSVHVIGAHYNSNRAALLRDMVDAYNHHDALVGALDDLLEAEWMVTHDWGGDRDSIYDKAQAVLAAAKGDA